MVRRNNNAHLGFKGARRAEGASVCTRFVVVLDLAGMREIRRERESDRRVNVWIGERELETWSFREDFDWWGLRWLQDSRWERINLQVEDPESGWEPDLTEQEVLEWHGLA
ncbi:uncharacterized protein [Prorops nasuta]|uniref:uncharacterized protein n=1 Tax=Prorops nasuta TaxID=863751 RepID=UPI0034CF4D47